MMGDLGSNFRSSFSRTLVNWLVDLVDIVVALHDELRIEGDIVQRRHRESSNATQNEFGQEHGQNGREVRVLQPERVKRVSLDLGQDDAHIIDVEEPRHVEYGRLQTRLAQSHGKSHSAGRRRVYVIAWLRDLVLLHLWMTPPTLCCVSKHL